LVKKNFRHYGEIRLSCLRRMQEAVMAVRVDEAAAEDLMRRIDEMSVEELKAALRRALGFAAYGSSLSTCVEGPSRCGGSQRRSELLAAVRPFGVPEGAASAALWFSSRATLMELGSSLKSAADGPPPSLPRYRVG
jgi:hypothetical protein